MDLERLEKAIIAVLVLTLLAGAGILLYRRSRPPVPVSVGRYSVGEEERLRKARININKASADELMALKGVGKVLAGRIVENRQVKGLYLSPDDLKRVQGVGPALYEKIKDEISVE